MENSRNSKIVYSKHSLPDPVLIQRILLVPSTWVSRYDLAQQAGHKEIAWHMSPPEKPMEKKTGEIFKDPLKKMVFANMPAGSFKMGSEDGERDEKPVHQVLYCPVNC